MLRWVPISAGWWMLKEVGRQSAGSGPEVDGFNESTRRNQIQCDEVEHFHTYQKDYTHTVDTLLVSPGARIHSHTNVHTHTLVNTCTHAYTHTYNPA